MGSPITSLALSMDSVFASAGNFVGRYVRGKEVGRMIIALPEEDDSSDSDSDMDSDSDDEESTPKLETLTNLLVFGTTLVALSHSGRKMFVWDIPPYVKAASNPNGSTTTTTTPYATIEFGPGFIATKVIHPATYLNKVVVGSKDGSLAVWNIRTG